MSTNLIVFFLFNFRAKEQEPYNDLVINALVTVQGVMVNFIQFSNLNLFLTIEIRNRWLVCFMFRVVYFMLFDRSERMFAQRATISGINNCLCEVLPQAVIQANKVELAQPQSHN